MIGADGRVIALFGLVYSASLMLNIYIVGLNQLTDVDIDRINKPYLPIAAGAFTMQTGLALVVVTGILALGIMAIGQMMIWVLSERLGVLAGLSAESIGVVIAIVGAVGGDETLVEFAIEHLTHYDVLTGLPNLVLLRARPAPDAEEAS